jgi:hypothetical protein
LRVRAVEPIEAIAGPSTKPERVTRTTKSSARVTISKETMLGVGEDKELRTRMIKEKIAAKKIEIEMMRMEVKAYEGMLEE